MGTLWTGARGHMLPLNRPDTQPHPLLLGVVARAAAVTSPSSGKLMLVTIPRSFQGIFIPPLVNSTLP